MAVCAGMCVSSALAQDLGEYAGYQSGSIDSETVSPPGLAWATEDGGGPNGGDCILSGLLWTGGDPSIAQLSLTGPGVLSFKWSVSSLADDGVLSCRITKGGETADIGRISGEGGGWVAMDVFVPQGEHMVSWIYRKLTYLSGGEDTGRVAEVDFTPTPAAPQTFDAYKTLHGVSGSGSSKIGPRRLDTSWLMGLSPAVPTPALLSQVAFTNGEARFRMRHSLRATGLTNPVFGTDLAGWTGGNKRSQLVAGSVTGETLEMEYIMPAASRRFFRCDHSPQVASPSANLVYIPPGKFLAGSPKSEVGRVWTGYISGNHGSEEDNQHEVTLTRGFFLCKFEATWAEWLDGLGWAQANGYVLGSGNEARGGRHLLQASGGNSLNCADPVDPSTDHPVTNVSFFDTMKWLNAKSEREGFTPCFRLRLKPALGGGSVVLRNQGTADFAEILCDWSANGYRVPTEAEWEYACRAGMLTSLNNGLNLSHGRHYATWSPPPPGPEAALNDPNLDPIASYFGNTASTHPVGSLAPNAFGLFDMHGNAEEWCWDLHTTQVPQQFTGEALVDPKGPALGESRMKRGGSWRMPGHMMRSASRNPAPKPIGTAGNSRESGIRYCRNAPE